MSHLVHDALHLFIILVLILLIVLGLLAVIVSPAYQSEVHIVYIASLIHQIFVVIVSIVVLVVVELDPLVRLSLVEYKLAVDPDVVTIIVSIAFLVAAVPLGVLDNQFILVADGDVGGFGVADDLPEARFFLVELEELVLDHGALPRTELVVLVVVIGAPADEASDAAPTHVGVDHVVAFLQAHSCRLFFRYDATQIGVIVEQGLKLIVDHFRLFFLGQ